MDDDGGGHSGGEGPTDASVALIAKTLGRGLQVRAFVLQITRGAVAG